MLKRTRDADGDIDEDDAKSKQKLVDDLGKAQQVAQDNANKKAPVKPDNPSHLVGVGNSREGQKKDGSEGVAKLPPKEEVKNVAEVKMEPEEMAKVELAAFLNKSPGTFTDHESPKVFKKIWVEANLCSCHLFQELLPLLQARKGHPSRQIYD